MKYNYDIQGMTHDKPILIGSRFFEIFLNISMGIQSFKRKTKTNAKLKWIYLIGN